MVGFKWIDKQNQADSPGYYEYIFYDSLEPARISPTSWRYSHFTQMNTLPTLNYQTRWRNTVLYTNPGISLTVLNYK